jgi:hypothetical protein
MQQKKNKPTLFPFCLFFGFCCGGSAGAAPAFPDSPCRVAGRPAGRLADPPVGRSAGHTARVICERKPEIRQIGGVAFFKNKTL